MNRALIVLLGLAAGASAACSRPAEQATETLSEPAPSAPPRAASLSERLHEESEQVTLYLSDAEGVLRPEAREMAREQRPSRRARRLVEELLTGSRTGLSRTLPSGGAVLEVYLTADGTAYVDTDAAFGRGLARGSEDALVALTSLTNTLAVNMPEVRRVKVMIEGQEVQDLGGHLDLSRPLLPDLGLVSGDRAGAPR